MWPPYLEHWPVGHFFRSFDHSLEHFRQEVLLAGFWCWHLSQQQTHGSPRPGVSRSVTAGEEIVDDVNSFLVNYFEVLLFTVEWLRTGCCCWMQLGGSHPVAGGWREAWWCRFACLEFLLPMVGCWRGARWFCLLLKKCSKKFDEYANCAGIEVYGLVTMRGRSNWWNILLCLGGRLCWQLSTRESSLSWIIRVNTIIPSKALNHLSRSSGQAMGDIWRNWEPVLYSRSLSRCDHLLNWKCRILPSIMISIRMLRRWGRTYLSLFYVLFAFPTTFWGAGGRIASRLWWLVTHGFLQVAGLKERSERRLGSNNELCVGRSFEEDEVDLFWFVVLWRGFDSYTQILDVEWSTGCVKKHLGWWEELVESQQVRNVVNHCRQHIDSSLMWFGVLMKSLVERANVATIVDVRYCNGDN
jgi:hypothetical protein